MAKSGAYEVACTAPKASLGGRLSALTPAGVYLFNTFLRRVELRRLFFNLTLIGAAAGFTQLLLVTGKFCAM